MLDLARSLRNAIVDGNQAKVEECLAQSKIDVNSTPFPQLTHEGRFSLLQFAAYMRQNSVVELLIRHGADPEARDGFDGTALHVAAGIKGNYEVVQTLLKHGANADADPHWFGSALQIAVNVPDNEDITQLLLDHGADVNRQVGRYHTALQTAARVSNNKKQLELLLNRGADASIQGGAFGTALQAAAFSGEVGAVEALLPRSAAVINAVGGKVGSTINAAALSGKITILKLLVRHGADLELVAPLPSKSSLLHFAVTAGNPSIIEFLLDHGAMIHLDSKNVDGETPLFRSVSHTTPGDVPTTRLLLERGAVADNEDHAGTFPLEHAVREKDLPMAALLYPYANESRKRLSISQWRECFGASPYACIELTGGKFPRIGCITKDKVLDDNLLPSPGVWTVAFEKGGLNNQPIRAEEPQRAM